MILYNVQVADIHKKIKCYSIEKIVHITRKKIHLYKTGMLKT